MINSKSRIFVAGHNGLVGSSVFKVLKENSYMLFDDYNWNFHKYGKNPINAINLFLKINKEKLKIIYVSEQVLIQKI